MDKKMKELEELNSPNSVINGILDMRGMKMNVTFLRNGKTDDIFSVTNFFADLDHEINKDQEKVLTYLEQRLAIERDSVKIMQDQ